jgi:hypothetical protein
VHWVGQVSCAEDGVVHDGDRGGDHGGGGNNCGGGNNSVVAKTNSVVTKTNSVVAKTSKDDLSISISLPLLVVVSMVMVVVQGRGTGDWVVGGVDTRGALVAQGVAVVGESVVASVVAVVGVGTPLPAAGHCGTKVVGAETNVARVDEASRGGGNSVDGVGQSRVSEDGRGNGVVAETVANRPKTSNNHLCVSLGFPLPAAGHGSSKVVGAESDMAGVDETSRGGGNSVDGVGQSRVAKNGRGNSVVAETNSMVTKTSKDDLRVSLGLPLSILGSIGKSSVGQGGTSAGHGQVQSVHTRGTLASEGVHSVSIGESESGVDHVGRSDGRKRGKSNKELHDSVW